MSDQLLPIRVVMATVGLCKSRIYELMAAKRFPQRVVIDGAVRWSRDEVAEWIEARKAERPIVEEVHA